MRGTSILLPEVQRISQYRDGGVLVNHRAHRPDNENHHGVRDSLRISREQVGHHAADEEPHEHEQEDDLGVLRGVRTGLQKSCHVSGVREGEELGEGGPRLSHLHTKRHGLMPETTWILDLGVFDSRIYCCFYCN